MTPNLMPAGGHRGNAPDNLGCAAVLETGTWVLEWKLEKPVVPGPKGWNDSICLSDVKIEVPSALWPVMTRRGGVSWKDAIF